MRDVTREEYWDNTRSEILYTLENLPYGENADVELLRNTIINNLSLLMESEDKFMQSFDFLTEKYNRKNYHTVKYQRQQEIVMPYYQVY